jgi:hypothetical protein
MAAINDQIRKLQKGDLGELADLIDQYGIATRFDRTTDTLDDDFRRLSETPVNKLSADEMEAICGLSSSEIASLKKGGQEPKEKRLSQHRRNVSRMVDRMKSHRTFRPLMHDSEAWNHLIESCAAFVDEAVQAV